MLRSKIALLTCVNSAAITARVLVLVVLVAAVSGCTFMLPESQNLPSDLTQTSTSNANITVSVQSLGERQRYSLSPLISYDANDGYKLAVYEVNVTNLNGAVQAGTTTFFTLAVDNGTVYDATLTSFALRVIAHGQSLSGTVVFELPQSAGPREMRYSDGNNWVLISV